MPLANTINQITTAELAYAPAVLAGVQIAESANADGASKAQAVVNGIIAGSQQLATSAPQPTVAGIAALVNLTVSILNALGIFSHAKPAAQTVPAAVANVA